MSDIILMKMIYRLGYYDGHDDAVGDIREPVITKLSSIFNLGICETLQHPENTEDLLLKSGRYNELKNHARDIITMLEKWPKNN